MKLSKILSGTALVMGLASSAHAVAINVDSAGTNITNEGVSLVPFIWQGTAAAPDNNNAATRFDWLATGGTYTPGQVQGYNLITSASLPQPTNSVAVVSDDSAAGNVVGYSLGAGFQYYVTAHFGGYYVAWVIDATNLGDKYTVPTSINAVIGANAYGAAQVIAMRLDDNGKNVKYNGGGLSNVRIWQGGEIPDDGLAVPDGGTTVSLFGLSLLGIGGLRRWIGSRKA